MFKASRRQIIAESWLIIYVYGRITYLAHRNSERNRMSNIRWRCEVPWRHENKWDPLRLISFLWTNQNAYFIERCTRRREKHLFWRVFQARTYACFLIFETSHLYRGFRLQPRTVDLQIKNRFQIMNSELRGIILWWTEFHCNSHWHQQATQAVMHWRQRTVKCDVIECLLVGFTTCVQFNKCPL
jgi:hypothetical protein